MSIETALQKPPVWGNISALPRDSTEVRDDGVDWTPYLDDIARGVVIRLGALTNHEMTIIARTVTIARSLKIPEDQIGRWATARQNQ